MSGLVKMLAPEGSDPVGIKPDGVAALTRLGWTVIDEPQTKPSEPATARPKRASKTDS